MRHWQVAKAADGEVAWHALALASQVIGQGLLIFALGQLSPLMIGIGLLTQPIVIAADEFSALPSIVIDLIMLAVVATARAAASGTQSREQAVVR